MDNKDLEIMIPSMDVRKFVLDTGYTFTDWQKAALLYRSDAPMNAARAALYALRDATGDIALQSQLTAYLSREEKALQKLEENNGRDFIYILTYREEPDEEEETQYFFDYEMALRYGIQTKVAFRIEKHLVGAEKITDQFEDGIYRDCVIASINYNENGEIACFDSMEIPPLEWDSGEEWRGRFDNMFYEVPNPFNRGDIVKIVGTEDFAIMETTQNEWKDLLERYKTPEGRAQMAQSDVAIKVIRPNDDAKFRLDSFNPVDLELCEIRWTRDSSAFEIFLYCAGGIYGRTEDDDFHIDIYQVLQYAEKYREEKKKERNRHG